MCGDAEACVVCMCCRSSTVSEELYSTHSGFYELPGICQPFVCDLA